MIAHCGSQGGKAERSCYALCGRLQPLALHQAESAPPLSHHWIGRQPAHTICSGLGQTAISFSTSILVCSVEHSSFWAVVLLLRSFACCNEPTESAAELREGWAHLISQRCRWMIC